MLKSLVAALRRLFASLLPGGAAPSSTVAAAMSAQPLVMTIDAYGLYPTPGPGGALVTLGMVHSFAGNYAPFDAPVADGRLLPIMENETLWSVIGTTYGGDSNNVAVPNLAGRAAIGVSANAPAGTATARSLAMTWMIAVNGFWPTQGYPCIGTVALFAGADAPSGWVPADGRTLPVASNQALFALLGTAFGGDMTNFALPDLRGRTPVGIGNVPGGMDITLGMTIDDGAVPGLGLNMAVRDAGGIFPVRGGSGGGYPEADGAMGEVAIFATNMPLTEAGWLPANGAAYPIMSSQALFAIMSNRFGGDGVTTFAMPDLRGRYITGGG